MAGFPMLSRAAGRITESIRPKKKEEEEGWSRASERARRRCGRPGQKETRSDLARFSLCADGLEKRECGNYFRLRDSRIPPSLSTRFHFVIKNDRARRWLARARGR